MTDPLARLREAGVSVWLDDLSREGLRSSSLAALCGRPAVGVRQCAVSGLPGSGTPDEQIEAAGISASRITARELIKN